MERLPETLWIVIHSYTSSLRDHVRLSRCSHRWSKVCQNSPIPLVDLRGTDVAPQVKLLKATRVRWTSDNRWGTESESKWTAQNRVKSECVSRHSAQWTSSHNAALEYDRLRHTHPLFLEKEGSGEVYLGMQCHPSVPHVLASIMGVRELILDCFDDPYATKPLDLASLTRLTALTSLEYRNQNSERLTSPSYAHGLYALVAARRKQLVCLSFTQGRPFKTPKGGIFNLLQTCGPFLNLQQLKLVEFDIPQEQWTMVLESAAPRLHTLCIDSCRFPKINSSSSSSSGNNTVNTDKWGALQNLTLTWHPSYTWNPHSTSYKSDIPKGVEPRWVPSLDAWYSLRILSLEGVPLTELLLDACPHLQQLKFGYYGAECSLESVIAIAFGTRTSRIEQRPAPTYSVVVSKNTRVTPDARWSTYTYKPPLTPTTIYKISMGDMGSKITSFLSNVCGSKRHITLDST